MCVCVCVHVLAVIQVSFYCIQENAEKLICKANMALKQKNKSNNPNMTNAQVPECKHFFGITSSQLKQLNWHVSKTSGTLSWTVSADRRKPQKWPFSTSHKTQFRNRIFLFPFLYSKERMWLDLMRREVESEGDMRLGKPLLKPNYRNSKCNISGFKDAWLNI